MQMHVWKRLFLSKFLLPVKIYQTTSPGKAWLWINVCSHLSHWSWSFSLTSVRCVSLHPSYPRPPVGTRSCPLSVGSLPGQEDHHGDPLHLPLPAAQPQAKPHAVGCHCCHGSHAKGPTHLCRLTMHCNCDDLHSQSKSTSGNFLLSVDRTPPARYASSNCPETWTPKNQKAWVVIQANVDGSVLYIEDWITVCDGSWYVPM